MLADSGTGSTEVGPVPAFLTDTIEPPKSMARIIF
jgi:hypothetical protein